MTIKDKFKQLKKQNKKAFIAYVPFGFPSIRYTKNIILTFQGSGVDIIELGIPLSDPIADGPIIQEATTIALNKGATTEKLFSTLQEIKKSLKVPLVLMTYYNPVYKFGMERFFKNMQITGVSGIMIVDLPVEESKDYIRQARKYDLETIFLLPL
jgi:tryptophan synthase alpha chain